MRITRQRKRALGAAIAAVLLGLGAYLAFNAPPPETAADFGSGQLLYQDTQGIYVRALDAGLPPQPAAGEQILGIRSFAIATSPRSPWITYVDTVRRDDTEPILHLLHTESREQEEIGHGLGVQWSPDGTSFAYLKPLAPERCTEEACRGEVEVSRYDVEEGAETALLGPGRWELLGWAGAHLLVEDRAAPRHTVTVGPGGDAGSLDIPAENVFAPSPNGRWVVYAGGLGEPTLFVPLEDGAIAGEPNEIPLGRREALTQGAWAPDSSLLAFVVRGGRDNVVRVMPPENPHGDRYPGSEGAFGRVMWAHNDASRFAYARLNEGTDSLEGVLCPADPTQGECRVLLRWQTGVAMLRLQ